MISLVNTTKNNAYLSFNCKNCVFSKLARNISPEIIPFAKDKVFQFNFNMHNDALFICIVYRKRYFYNLTLWKGKKNKKTPKVTEYRIVSFFFSPSCLLYFFSDMIANNMIAGVYIAACDHTNLIGFLDNFLLFDMGKTLPQIRRLVEIFPRYVSHLQDN